MAWDLPEVASDHQKTVSKPPGTFSALSEGPGTFGTQRQTTEDGSKIIEIMEIVENGSIWLTMG